MTSLASSASQSESVASLLAGDEIAQRALTPVAETLFREMLAFGRLAPFTPFALPWSPDVKLGVALERYRERASTIGGYLGMLEAHAGLHFAGRLPFVMNTVDWDPGVPVAGYTGGSDSPRPTQVVSTLLGGWRAEAQDGFAIGSAQRLGRSALFMTAVASASAAVALVIDLLSHGFCSRGAAAEILRKLVLTRVGVGQDSDVVGALLDPSEVPASQAEWVASTVQVIPTGGGSSAGGDSPDWRPDMGPVVLPALEGVRRLRGAATWDEWIVESFMLARRLSGVKYVSEVFEGSWPIALATVLSQLEEIKADRAACEAYIGKGELTSAEHLLAQRNFREFLTGDSPEGTAMFTEDVRLRLGKQRVFLPDHLATLGDREFTEAIGRGAWRCVSWRLIHPLLSLYRIDVDPASVSPAVPDVDEVLAQPRIKRFAASWGLDVDQAVEYSKNAESDEGLPFPIADWLAAVADATSEVNHARLTEVMQTAAAEVRDATEAAPAIAACDRALESFPWAASLHHLRGLAHMGHDLTEESIDALLPAVALSPTHTPYWEALAVALNASGRDREGRLCLAVGMTLGRSAFDKPAEGG